MSNILVIDDEREVTTFFHYLLSRRGHQVEVAHTVNDVNRILKIKQFDLALIDLKLPDTDGLSLLEMIKNQQPACEAIIMTGFSTIQTAVKAMQRGAFDYIEKPFDDIDKLEALIESSLHKSGWEKELGELEAKALDAGCVIGQSQNMKRLYLVANKIAQKHIPVLIVGETGTGKEVLARFIHKSSPRLQEAFLGVNCGAIAESILESELFGHEKGAFTGANQIRKGIFEMTCNGTLFLDEIGEATLQTQVKLLRVLETHEFMRIGGERVIRTNSRVISATNVDLENACKEKSFRLDLLYRLEGVKLEIPPLRARKDDIPILVEHFLKRIPDAKHITFSQTALEILQEYDWPGNLRELANVVTQVVALQNNENCKIDESDLPDKLKRVNRIIKINKTSKEIGEIAESLPKNNAMDRHLSPVQAQSDFRQEAQDPLKSVDQLMQTIFEYCKTTVVNRVSLKKGFDLEEFQLKFRECETKVIQEMIQETLHLTMGNQKKAGQLLGISPRTLRYLLNEKGKGTDPNESVILSIARD